MEKKGPKQGSKDFLKFQIQQYSSSVPTSIPVGTEKSDKVDCSPNFIHRLMPRDKLNLNHVYVMFSEWSLLLLIGNNYICNSIWSTKSRFICFVAGIYYILTFLCTGFNLEGKTLSTNNESCLQEHSACIR